MNEIEKRELIEQQQKILEAATQRADKRTGFFSFLTWPFFIAPLIFNEEFLAATQRSGAAEQEDSKVASVGSSPQAANDDPRASNFLKATAENEAAREPSASSQAHTVQFDPALFPAQSDEAPKLSAAQSEVVAAASAGDGDAGSDDVDFRHHDTHTSIEDSSVNLPSADFHFGSEQLPGASTLESLQSSGLADLLNPSTVGSAPLLGTVSGLSNNVIGMVTPIEPAVQPVPATVIDSVSTLSHDAVGTIAPVEAAVQPVLSTMIDAVSALAHDAVGTTAPVEAAVEPVLATASDAVSTLAHDAVGTNAPVEAAVEPVLATASDAVSTLAHDAVGTIAPVEAAVEPVLATASDAVSTLAHDAVGAIAPVEAAVQPVLSTVTDTVSVPSHDVGTDASTGHAPGAADALLALATATDEPIELPASAAVGSPSAVTSGSNAAAVDHPSAITVDVIALNDAPTPPAHALFNGSQYTNYGVALSSDIAAPSQSTAPHSGTELAHDTSVPAVADAQKQTPPPPDIVDTTHSIDHLGHAML